MVCLIRLRSSPLNWPSFLLLFLVLFDVSILRPVNKIKTWESIVESAVGYLRAWISYRPVSQDRWPWTNRWPACYSVAVTPSTWLFPTGIHCLVHQDPHLSLWRSLTKQKWGNYITGLYNDLYIFVFLFKFTSYKNITQYHLGFIRFSSECCRWCGLESVYKF